MTLTPEQVRGARAMARISSRELATMAGVTKATVTRFETGRGDMHQNNMAKVQAVLESAGITFLPDHGEGPGIRWRLPEGGST